MPSLTFLDIAKRTGSDSVIGLVEEVIQNQPELRVLPSRPKSGTTYKITRRTGLPSGGFRSANEGIDTSKSTYEQILAEMFFFDCPLQVDEAIVKADDKTLGDVLADEASGALEGSMNTLGTATWYGSKANSKGFDGLPNYLTDAVSAAGTGNSTCSAYLCWVPDNYKGVYFDIGNQGSITMPEWVKQQVLDSNNKKLMAYVSNLSFYIGLNVSSAKSVWRINNITAAKPLTDALAFQLLSKIPLSRRNNLRWFMNRDANYYLQTSRPVTLLGNAGGASKTIADAPTELAGFPITVTDSLTSTEAAS